ncbi:MAG: bifunctional phosphoribosylaminoimidazolecarboxamide formyltransferase/IMP cyclohydrolase [bacterium]|nr:bifunctional phosphoribosylaminoimidazolecarboxamide formyltransferase/IMP cyclohydrolase [bacterium]MDE0602532.1 bifunctional phosphoribosylaminoimidazolecarboxamide formyltransferase/IMP cyclohydrolase [bacterium]
MSGFEVRRALLSVADKTGIVEFARQLAESGAEIVSSVGTARAIREAGVEVTATDDVTGASEMLGGRVKTLHPQIHGGILADPDDPAHQEDLRRSGIEAFQLVAVNLYPFADEPGIEQIDIGGVALLRAAAKNHEHVAAVSFPHQYPEVIGALRSGGLDRESRRRLAAEAFAHTAQYDAAISRWFSLPEVLSDPLVITLRRRQEVRYGENPHQQGALYASEHGGYWASEVRRIQGKPMSYNNYADVEAAVRLAADLEGAGCVIVKHANPCGVGVGTGAAEAFARAWEGDPQSAFGGVVAFNCPVTASVAEDLRRVFVEVVAAPRVDPEAVAIFSRKPNLRVLETPLRLSSELEIRSLGADFLVQTTDRSIPIPSEWRVVSRVHPDAGQLPDLRLAWVVAGHAKSNAVVICRDGRSVGVGAGDQSRVGAARRAMSVAGDRARGAVAASDGFFPFTDGLDALASMGVNAVVSPGGSVRDSEVIAAADQHRMALVFTGRRHFRH